MSAIQTTSKVRRAPSLRASARGGAGVLMRSDASERTMSPSGRPTRAISRVRRSTSSTHDRGGSAEAVSSTWNFSDQATRGRNSNWSNSRMVTAMARTAQAIAE